MMAAYLGFDLSTQQLKVVAVDEQLQIICVESIVYDVDLPEFQAPSGIREHVDGVTVTAPTLMWVAAVDFLLEKLKAKLHLSSIKAISGCGQELDMILHLAKTRGKIFQQHGSVYWSHGARDVLRNLKPNEKLAALLKGAFSRAESPIWMDQSTGEQCRKLEMAVGGKQKLAEITGSTAFHRFTGPQIAKISENEPETYKNTERISLVSSFLCSIFVGDFAPIDFSDGSGMNLLDIRTRSWNSACLNQCGSNSLLGTKLGQPVYSGTVVKFDHRCVWLGKISAYFVKRYGFSPHCDVVTFTGDNPASLAGICQSEDDVAISLGTSDTVFLWLDSPKPQLQGHIFCNPVQENAYMALLCFKNGSLTRDRVRQSIGCQSWTDFNEILWKTSAGNHGNIGFYFDHPEILPDLSAGDYRFDPAGNLMSSFPAEIEARAVIEHQCLAKRLHARSLGYKAAGRILVTGGASANQAILQVLADVFNCPVYVQTVADSAAFGGAVRAKHATDQPSQPFLNIARGAVSVHLATQPVEQNSRIYEKMLESYEKLENYVIAVQKKK